jgi:lipopolysaccharide heptosyltransferase I
VRFLISRLSSLGDVVCTLPAAVALKSAYPGSTITWVVDPRFGDIVRSCTAVDVVVEAKKSLKREHWPELDEPFEAAFDLQGLFKSAWPVHLAKAREKLGYHWQREGSSFFSQKVLPDPSSFHIVDQYVDVVRAYGVDATRAMFGLVPTTDALASIQERLRTVGANRFIVANPGAGWASKRWPASSFAEVATDLQKVGIQTILIGGRSDGDKAIAAEVVKSSGANLIDWTAQTTIGELIALLSLAKGHIGGDTGSSHIAAALEIPCVGLYSVTNPRRSCPYGQIDSCLYDSSSLANIKASQVMAKLEGALA